MLRGKKTFIVENYPINVNKSTIKKLLNKKVNERDISTDGEIKLFKDDGKDLYDIFYNFIGMGTEQGSKKQRDLFHKAVDRKITDLLYDESVRDDTIGWSVNQIIFKRIRNHAKNKFAIYVALSIVVEFEHDY